MLSNDVGALLCADGMHPNANGGEVIARLVIEAIGEHYPSLEPAHPSEWRDMAPDSRMPLDFPDHKVSCRPSPTPLLHCAPCTPCLSLRSH